MDIGPKSAERFAEVIRRSNTLVWNGPPGVFENPAFAEGSKRFFAEIVEGAKTRHLTSIVGGGDTAAFVQSQGSEVACISHISTGGGASLELMEGKPLPGVLYLTDRE
jgi:phosphoglycerate kinase